MNPSWIEIAIGKMHLRSPVVVDEATTQRIAGLVNVRLEEIEKNSDRVDSYAFALLAAMSFAAELEEARIALEEERQRITQQAGQDTKEIFSELTRIVELLRT